MNIKFEQSEIDRLVFQQPTGWYHWTETFSPDHVEGSFATKVVAITMLEQYTEALENEDTQI